MPEGFVGHHGTEIGATDTDVDNIFDALASVALPLTTADSVGKYGHAVEDLVNLGNNIDPIDQDRGCARGPEGSMQNGTILGGVDFLAPEHGVDPVT